EVEGELDLAIRAYDEAILLDPDQSGCWSNRGEAPVAKTFPSGERSILSRPAQPKAPAVTVTAGAVSFTPGRWSSLPGRTQRKAAAWPNRTGRLSGRSRG